jgi:hypothetical protein
MSADHAVPPGLDRPPAVPRHRVAAAEAGSRARCPRCRALIAPDVDWCGQCHARLTSQPPTQTPSADAPTTQTPDQTQALAPSSEGLTGGQLPDGVVDALLTRLSVESAPVLPGRALALTGRGAQIATALGGALGLTALLVGIPALIAHLL